METMIKRPKADYSSLMNATDLARDLNVSRKTIYNWLDEGKIKQVDYLGKKLFDKSSIVGIRTTRVLGKTFVPNVFIAENRDMSIISFGFMVTLLGLESKDGTISYDKIAAVLHLEDLCLLVPTMMDLEERGLIEISYTNNSKKLSDIIVSVKRFHLKYS